MKWILIRKRAENEDPCDEGERELDDDNNSEYQYYHGGFRCDSRNN